MRINGGSIEKSLLWVELETLNVSGRIVCFVVWFLNVLVNHKVISRTGAKTERLTILRAVTRETELGDHDFCLSRSHYTDTDPNSRERAATAGISVTDRFVYIVQ